MTNIRLQKYIADAGYASRRKAEEIILQGRVTVNGTVINQLGSKVCENDTIEVDGNILEPAKQQIYIMLNKPIGCITTVNDQFGRKTVMNYLNGVKERVFPVGRLDFDTSGLLLLTNDGNLTYALTHPSHEIEKVYIAEVDGIPNKEEMHAFRKGLLLDDFKTAPAEIKILSSKSNKSILEIIIHEGKNRQVRRMCDAIEHPVIKLKRIRIGEIELGDLPEGKWRELTVSEVNMLKKKYQILIKK